VRDAPTVLRFPKGAVPAAVPAVRRFTLHRGANLPSNEQPAARPSGVDILAEPPADKDRDVLLVAVGAFGGMAVEAAARLAAQGIGVTVVDPRWVLPVPTEISALAADHRLVVTVEDGGRSGGVGAAVADVLAGSGVPVQVLALPQEFLEPGPRAELLGDLGLTAQAVARGITEEIARTSQDQPGTSGSPVSGDREPGATG